MCKTSDPYRPGLWSGRVDQLFFSTLLNLKIIKIIFSAMKAVVQDLFMNFLHVLFFQDLLNFIKYLSTLMYLEKRGKNAI